MEKKLTVCLPTYNRLEYIKKQLEFFEKEISNDVNILEKVHFIVADNCSTDGSRIKLKKIQAEKSHFNFVYNEKNLGLVGNIINLLHLSKTEYVWFVSDDDELQEGILKKILEVISTNDDVSFIFLNYLINGNKGFASKNGYFKNSKEIALEIFNEGYGSLVFMTACVHKRENLHELSSSKMFDWLSGPMLYSFYSCSKGSIYVTNDAWINFRSGNASYAGFKRNLKLKFEEYITILESLPNYEYDKVEVIKTIKNFFKSQSHSHLFYNFVDIKNSLKLYKRYYSFRAFLNLPVNIIRYIKK